MARIKAFRALRPNENIAENVAALPYDVYNRQEAKAEVEREPLSFLKIDRAETQFADDIDTYAPEVYQKAHDILWEMVADGSFLKEEKPCFYIYELIMDGRSQTGLVACSAVDDYLNGIIKKHENTLESKLVDRICHVDACNAQTGPIFLAYRQNQTIADCLKEVKKKAPIFDFTAPDGIIHRGWRIDEEEKIHLITDAFAKIPETYIADGHHRTESAVQVSLKRREAAKVSGITEKECEYDYFLSVLFAEDELQIMDYNRVVEDLNGLTEEQFLEAVNKVCKTTLMETYVNLEQDGHPKRKGNMRMYLNGSWYDLEIREKFRSDDPVEGLDVFILQHQILDPILGIKNPKTDMRIKFVGGIRGLEELVKMTDTCKGVAFAMNPTSMQELFEVADAGLLMPPKSTWFEPKLRSGLFIHALD